MAHRHGVGPGGGNGPMIRENTSTCPRSIAYNPEELMEICSLGLDASPTTEMLSQATRYDEENVMYPLEMNHALCIDFR